ncbi:MULTISPECIES: DegV family protein [unclassified Bacillus (in: firmicutes)]|uniref:DegV family protein n=1 Tax=unclassified Bacillus (in: firmicutes) TaxID=185979 RepID=UPI0008E19AB0|nr:MULTISPECIES: DegV family protein [unclassified Bacillus (in: firmicutes)]SFI78158.1 EDD domain protein, DegV family [Bacillus sp. 71mf]SFS86391.1 EDD domain protein, DegV family [Bacillus sp. 103mf]
MTIKIITDSAADLPKELLHTYDIEVIPLRVYDEQENEFFDGITLDPIDLLRNMREGKVYKTSLPSLEKIQEVFTTYAKQDATCIYLAFSSELSGTYQSSVLVKEEVKETYPNFSLDIIDTKCVSIGQGLVVLEAAKLAQSGATKEEVLNRIAFMTKHMEHIVTVADLQYLVRGGRLSKVAGFIGGLLNIKPILNIEEGKLIPLEKIRGRKKVFQHIIDMMETRGKDLENQTIGISHGDDLESVNILAEMITEKFGCKVFVVNSIGAAVGAHAGPGTLAIFFLNEL